MPQAESETMYREVGARLPVGRVGEAAGLAEAYVFLMRQGFATGQTFTVDCGGVLVQGFVGGRKGRLSFLRK